MIAKFLNSIGEWLRELVILDQAWGTGQAGPSAGNVSPVTRTDEGLSRPIRDHRV
jgi:hypothetical protein